MKRTRLIGLILVLSCFLILPVLGLAQGNQVRASLKASVMQRLGVDADITIEYSRPGVKGRTIWGDLVPYGLAPGNRYSKDQPYPWRAGANENTTIEFTKDVQIEDFPVPAGKYSIHMVPAEKSWTLIFNKKTDGWGSFAYSKDEDFLRVTVTPVKAHHQEWLAFGFENLAGTSATAFLHWEELKVPFVISLPKE